MAGSRPLVSNTVYEDKIRLLSDDLHDARMCVIRLLPDPIRKILGSYSQCKTNQDTIIWQHRISGEVISLATPIVKGNIYDTSDRANCPLCGEGSLHPSRQGYSLPERLRRHLEGWGSTSPCMVMKVSYELAREYWDRKFGENGKQK